MLLNEDAMGKILYTHRLIAWAHNTAIIACLPCGYLHIYCAAFISLTGGFMDPDPTPHHRWSITFSR
ncbi:mgtA regulatory leader peptide MgtL [[Enterobacter] lignolyticus]|uniref:mgtA leader peptide n=1 Tax=Enterobacter lignolyticus (strain SCF1) TaxID=701347 RepID=E3GCH8_ENTLS|nr:hypothetical protein Entcl_3910 [[Enterobacter] lignolyticus SCF1]